MKSATKKIVQNKILPPPRPQTEMLYSPIQAITYAYSFIPPSTCNLRLAPTPEELIIKPEVPVPPQTTQGICVALPLAEGTAVKGVRICYCVKAQCAKSTYISGYELSSSAVALDGISAQNHLCLDSANPATYTDLFPAPVKATGALVIFISVVMANLADCIHIRAIKLITG